MLTNPSQHSTAVSSSLVEISSSSLTPPSESSDTPSSTITPIQTTAVPPPVLNPQPPPQSPTKRKKKAPTASAGPVPALGAEVISSGLVTSLSAPPPSTTPGNNGNANNGRKRSRKQEINLLQDASELSPLPESKTSSAKSAKRKKNSTGTPNSVENNAIGLSVASQSLNKKGKNPANKSASANPPKRKQGAGLLKRNKKNNSNATVSTSSIDNSIVSYDPQQKIVLRKNEFIDPNLSFTIFPDLSRGLGAIGPSQVILAVESTREVGTREELVNDLGGNKTCKQDFSCKLFSLFLSVPHFLPLISVYNSGEPFARILRYTALEQYTNGVLGKNQVSTFRFYGPRYEKQVPAISASQEKNPKVVEIRKKNPIPDAYQKSLLIIKHPILGFYSRKLVNLKFIVLKKIHLRDRAAEVVVGHLKAKVVQLRRSADLKNIEIYVDESRVPEAASDVNAMNQQNLQPVIQTPSGLVPVITSATYQAQQEYQIEQHQQLMPQAESQQFQYVQYHYQNPSELVQEITNASSNGGGSNYIFSLDNSASEYFRDENGTQVLILSPSGELHSPNNYLQAQPQQQQIIHHQQEQQSNFYGNQEQPLIVQHHQSLTASQHLQLQQQQQAYTIQQQEQQVIQIQPPEQQKEVQKHLILLPGTNIPIEIQFPGSGINSTAATVPVQVVAESQPTRVYAPQLEQQVQIQIQPSQQQQQFRSAQQIIVQQQQQTQTHFQAVPQQQQHPVQQQQHPVQQQLASSQSQVVIRQQQQQHQSVNQSNATSTQQAYQYRNVSQQQQIVVQQQQTQQSHVHTQSQQQQLHQVASSCVQQAHHHQAQLNQLQGSQQQQSSPVQPIRFQTVIQQPAQPLLHSQQGQPRTQVIPQQQTVPVLQSPPSQAPLPASPIYQQQRPSFTPQQQQPPPLSAQQQHKFSQVQPSGSLSVPQAPASPGVKQKKPKGSKKRPKEEGAYLINQTPSDSIASGQFLTPHQLEQLRHREQKKVQPPSTAQPPLVQPPQRVPPLGPVQPGFIPPRYANPSTSAGITSIAPPQHQQPQLLHLVPRKTGPGSQAPRSQRPPAPPPPIISSTTSIARFPTVSSGTPLAGLSVAPKSQNTSVSTPTPSSLTASLSASSNQQSTTPGGNKKPPKTFIVVSSPPGKSVAAAPPPPSAPPRQEFKTKPGHLAVCPHCGVGNKNILRCNRCKHELPAVVKFIKDEWFVNKAGAAVAVPASKPTSPPLATTSSASENNNISKAVTVGTTVNRSNSKAGGATGRKILLVNKPQPPLPAAQASGPSGVSNNKTIIAPGTVHIQIQPDGGSAVTINSGGVNVVQGKTPASVVTKPAAPKKRAPARKRQAHELITLSSDDEEPEPPKPKVSKQEEKSVSSGVVTASSSVLTPSSKSNTQNTTVSSSTSTTTTTTTTAITNTSTTNSPATNVPSVSDCATATAQAPSGVLTSQSTTVIKKESDKVTATASSTIANQTENTNMPKPFKINLSLNDIARSPEEEKYTENGPNEVLALIEKRMGTVGDKFEFAVFMCRSIRVGSYKVTSSDLGYSTSVAFTELGIKFLLPHANYKHKKVKVCIPMESLLDVKVHFSKRLQVIFITTGPKYATWVRKNLGLDGSSANESSNYYCPMNGLPCQKTITMLGDEVPNDADVGTIQKLYLNVLSELTYDVANELLMKVTPQSYKGSIGYQSGSPPAESPSSSSPGPRIVSTTSMAARVSSPTGSQVSNVSSASTVIISKQDIVSTGVNTPGANSNADDDGVVLFYEGRNNIKVPICPNDIKCLAWSQFLNDQIIDFWLAVIQTEFLQEQDRNRTFIFDSFFYSKLTEKMKRKNEDEGNMTAGERRHSRVKKRTKNVDIFSKDFLIVPINENYHWFIAIICFPGLEGYHDYDSLEPLPNYKRPRTMPSKSSKSTNNKKPVVFNQPKNDSTAAYSNRDEAPEDPEENDQISSPDTPGTDVAESKSLGKTESGESSAGDKGSTVAPGTKRKSEFSQCVKHPCILIFDSLAGEARGRIYSTLREYLRIEYKTKKNTERTFDKSTMPGVMPKVPQQPNFSDCGLFMLQYIESFFSHPIPNYEPKDINLKLWFLPSIAENKRREIYDFIKTKVMEKCPHNASRIPEVNFEPDEHQSAEDEEYRRLDYDPDDEDHDYFDDEDFEDDDEFDSEDEEFQQMIASQKQSQLVNSKKPKKEQQTKPGSDNEDHNYATTPPKTSSAATLAGTLPTVVVAITPLPPQSTSDTTLNRNA